VENKFGVLVIISALFVCTWFNIASLSVSEMEHVAILRMAIVVKDNKSILEQITKQLYKKSTTLMVSGTEKESLLL
jgi:acetolactate synthase small subunit